MDPLAQTDPAAAALAGHVPPAGAPATTSAAPAPTPTETLSTPESIFDKVLKDNPIFGAGAGLMGLGLVLTGLRRGVKLGALAARRRMLITLEIPSKDRSYPWFLEWMAAQAEQARAVPLADRGLRGAFSGKINQLPSHELAVETTYKQHDNGASEALFNLVPGPGTHYFRYGGHWFQVKRERDSKLMDLHSGTPWETLTLTGLSSSRTLLPGLLAEARTLAERGTEGKTVVYTAWGTEWRPFGKPRPRREMGSVVLAAGVAERVESDLKAFLGRHKWYAERGIPYRRGYMLFGPPGSGKTSFIQALAGSMGYNICLLNLAERGLTDDKLNHLLGLVPDRSFVLLEDVDSAFTRRVQTSEDGFKSSVTFSGLLNALDGVASSEERVIFMTTNHVDKLDPALVRPGRVDVSEVLGDAAGEQAKRLFVKFYGHAADEASAARVESAHSADRSSTSTSTSTSTGASTEPTPETSTVDPLLHDEHLSPADVAALGDHVAAIVDAARAQGRSVSMASLQGHFIRHGARQSIGGVDALCKAHSR